MAEVFCQRGLAKHFGGDVCYPASRFASSLTAIGPMAPDNPSVRASKKWTVIDEYSEVIPISHAMFEFSKQCSVTYWMIGRSTSGQLGRALQRWLRCVVMYRSFDLRPVRYRSMGIGHVTQPSCAMGLAPAGRPHHRAIARPESLAANLEERSNCSLHDHRTRTCLPMRGAQFHAP